MERRLLLLSTSPQVPSIPPLSSNISITTTTNKKTLIFTKNWFHQDSNLRLSVKCQSQSSDYFEQQQQQQYSQPPRFSPSYNPIPSPPLSPGFPPKVFVGHSIYKGKAALTVEPRAPEFVSLGSGSSKISRVGFIRLQFSPAAGFRQYDWSRKQVFTLSVAEIGTLLSLGAKESCEFFHDPNIGTSDEGKVRKVLKVDPIPDGSGHFFNLSVQDKLQNMDLNISLPVTRGEFAVLISAFNYILPYLLGWHAFTESRRPEDKNRVDNASPKGQADFEWSR